MQNDSVLPPAYILTVQLEYQLTEEDFHYLVVGVGLNEREVHFAGRIQRSKHGNPRLHRQLWDRVGC